ncbi:hypothetical protein [uncultured Piscinibacter sp.]|uniref:hypothetical protein n=1 Tax=uncultured Piscinibacter sp. TaxID=1131835 RepID=UPI0026350553|nr:hypothetical protein [uncultured Piscinibacter sp.]
MEIGHAPVPAPPAHTTVPCKTERGHEEISRRSPLIGPRMRAILLLVDGRRTHAELRRLGENFGVPEGSLESLESLGLIRIPKAAEPSASIAALPTMVVQPAPEPPVVAAAESIQMSLQPTHPEPPPPEPLWPEQLAHPVQGLQQIQPAQSIESKPAQPAEPVRPPAIEAQPRAPQVFIEAEEQHSEDTPAELRDLDSQRSGQTTLGGLLDTMRSSIYPLLESAFGGLDPVSDDEGPTSDPELVEVRRMLMREVRSRAPVAGAMTVMKLRRAGTREELLARLGEVSQHITQPMRQLSAQQILTNARNRLERPH